MTLEGGPLGVQVGVAILLVVASNFLLRRMGCGNSQPAVQPAAPGPTSKPRDTTPTKPADTVSTKDPSVNEIEATPTKSVDTVSTKDPSVNEIEATPTKPADTVSTTTEEPVNEIEAIAPAPSGLEIATFAAGCFWGVELAFQRVEGVATTEVGYIGGESVNPTYKEVKKGDTGHAEAVQLQYDPSVVSYDQLLAVFWKRGAVGGKFDPTKPNQQGNDKGTQYRSGIYWHTPEQQAAAEVSLAAAPKVLKLKPWQTVHVEVSVAPQFYRAEDKHQQYLSDKGGRKNLPQSSSKGCCDSIRCYG